MRQMPVALLHVMPHGLWYTAYIEQAATGNQLSPAMIRGAIHVNDFFVVGQCVVKVIEQFFQTFK